MVITINHRGIKLLGGEPRCWPLKKKKKNLSQDPAKCFPHNRPSAQTCLLTDVFPVQFKKEKRKEKEEVENSDSFTHLFRPGCVLHFVRTINCVSKHEDKLALWPLMRWHNSPERFIPAQSGSSSFPTMLPILLTPSQVERGEEVRATQAGAGYSASYVVLRSPQPSINTTLLSCNHRLRGRQDHNSSGKRD